MKEKIARLAKGIVDEELPTLRITPECFSETVIQGSRRNFTIGIESENGRCLKGACVCDEIRIAFSAASFLGRMSHLGFTLDTSGLPEGYVLAGTIGIISNAGEFSIPYQFTIGPSLHVPTDTEKQAENNTPLPAEQNSCFSGNVGAGLLFQEEEGVADFSGNTCAAFLVNHIPEDEDLLLDLAAMLIREGQDGPMAFAVYRKAIEHGLEVTHLYESYMDAVPEDYPDRLPRQVLLYYLYEKNIELEAADKLYSNIIRFEPEDSELYLRMEGRIRDHAMKSLLDERVSKNLCEIYDRMLYPDMIDSKAAAVLPDLVRTHRITTGERRAAFVHVRYPQLRKTFSQRFEEGCACIPVYFKDAVITLHSSDGSLLPETSFTNEVLMSRPDLLRRCFALDPFHPMLLLSAAREIAGRGIQSEEEKQVLVNALNELELEEDFKQRLIRVLCAAGGKTNWLEGISLSDLDADTGSFAFRAFLDSGRLKEAYRYLRSQGMEFFEEEDLVKLADGLLRNQEKPEENNSDTERFFLCLCKFLFDKQRATPAILTFLTEEYQGLSKEMAKILEEAEKLGLPLHDMPERALTIMLFAETRAFMDEVFTVYVKQQQQRELLLKAFFVFRMTDYFERKDPSVSADVFEALEAYFTVTRTPQLQPDILPIGLTCFYSRKTELDSAQTRLCQRLTDRLIEKELIFSYTKALRKKIRIPGFICEKFYVDYMGRAASEPVMTAKILPEETEYSPVCMKKVFHNVYVAAVVLFMGEKLCYMIRDSACGEAKEIEGSIEVKKMHGKEEDRYLQLNRMTMEAQRQDVQRLKNDMLSYAVSTQLNRKLFGIEDL